MAQAFLIGGNGQAIPSDGEEGQVLTKSSGTPYQVAWRNSLPSYTDATNGQVLRVNVSSGTKSLGWGSGLPEYSSESAGEALVLKLKSGSTTEVEPQWAEATPLYDSTNLNQVLAIISDNNTPKAAWTDLSSQENIVVHTANNVKTQVASTGSIYIVGGSTATASDHEALYKNSNVYINAASGVLMGAAWNDYAECRKGPRIEAGMCVVENGDDTLKLSDEYAHGSAYIVSDTYGMAIGQTDSATLPVALTGRVLAYTEEGRDLYTTHIGAPVCSGPNGKIVLMDKMVAATYPWAIIGTVSSVPTYEKWNGVEVDGRVWIKVK